MKQNRKNPFNSPQRKGLDYTQRQLEILNYEIPLAAIRTTELVALLNKARERNDEAAIETVQYLYDAKTNPNDYFPQMSATEAKAILQSLTPWPIDWDGKKKHKKRK